jgi:DNA-binding XRE family transcriptional regulator
MTDVVEIAKACRARLAAEIGSLEDFIRVAKALADYGHELGRGPVMGADAGHFAFDDEASVNEEELVLVDGLSDDDAPVGAHAGIRMRHRRWMLGISQQELGELVGLKSGQIQKYEAGESRLSTSSMRNIASALEVSVAYFLEDTGVQAPDTDEDRYNIFIDG